MTAALALLYGLFVGAFSAFFLVAEAVSDRLDRDLREVERLGGDIERTAQALGLDYRSAEAIYDLAGRLQRRGEGADPAAHGSLTAMRLVAVLFAALSVGASFVLPELSDRLVVVGVVGGFAATAASYQLVRARGLMTRKRRARLNKRVTALAWQLGERMAEAESGETTAPSA